MVVLELIFVVLHFEVSFSVEPTCLYYRAGGEVVLPCANVSPSDTTCSNVNWIYNRYYAGKTINEVQNGNVLESSVRAARLSLATNCSLVINNITAEDAGLYACQQGRDTDSEAYVSLSVLTISPLPPDADQQRDGQVTLECSLSRYSSLRPCQDNSIRWVDETGAVLRGEGVGYEVMRQTNCVSVLIVKRQSGYNRRYSCQFVEKNTVKTEADYTAFSSDDNISVIAGGVVGVGVVLLSVVIATVLLKYRKQTKVREDLQKSVHPHDEPESNLTYVTVSHHNQTPCKKKVKEEKKVIYSTINAVMKTETENDLGHLYSCVSVNQRN